MCLPTAALKEFKASKAKLAEKRSQLAVVRKSVKEQKKVLADLVEAAKKTLVKDKVEPAKDDADIPRVALAEAAATKKYADAVVKHHAEKKVVKGKLRKLESEEKKLKEALGKIKATHGSNRDKAHKLVTATKEKAISVLKHLESKKPAASTGKFADSGLDAESDASLEVDSAAEIEAAATMELDAALEAGDGVSAETEAILESLAESEMEAFLASTSEEQW